MIPTGGNADVRELFLQHISRPLVGRIRILQLNCLFWMVVLGACLVRIDRLEEVFRRGDLESHCPPSSSTLRVHKNTVHDPVTVDPKTPFVLTTSPPPTVPSNRRSLAVLTATASALNALSAR
jgi:hypothetical protein